MRARAFTLVELLVVVAIVALLAAIAVPNFRLAADRAAKSADAANLKVIASALQLYYVDNGTLPPADREAGPLSSSDRSFTAAGNGPAAGGSWDGLPWMLYEKRYVADWRMLFTEKYAKLYRGGTTIRGGHPRFHNFRYAYNAAAVSSGGVASTGVLSGTKWIVRNLWLPASEGFYAASLPRYPADYRYPWGEGNDEGKWEHALYADFSVRTVVGGKDDLAVVK